MTKQDINIQDQLDPKKWAKVQLSKRQAIAVGNSEVWKNWSAEEVVSLQLFQKNLCMDFDHFLDCLSKVLDRSIFDIELSNRDAIVEEYLNTTKK